MMGCSLIIFITRWLVDLDALCFNDRSDLKQLVSTGDLVLDGFSHTLDLKRARSAGLRVSALATTGIRFTLELKRFMTSISRGFRVWPVGLMK